jgi:hypothetical protein
MQPIDSLPNDLKGRTFLTEERLCFTVLAGEYYPLSGISKQHLDFCRQWLELHDGHLVALTYRGAPVPVIRVKGGVYRLTSIRRDDTGEVLKGSATQISRFLGLCEQYQPAGLFRP